MWYSIIALVIGCILDFLFGDPEYWWHPIRLIGNLISQYEKIFGVSSIKRAERLLVHGSPPVFGG